MKTIIALALLLASTAHAGLFSDLEKQDEARSEERMREGEARDLANRINMVRNAVAQAMGVDPSSVVYEGINDDPMYGGFEFRVGAWGCLGGLKGTPCINSQTGEHHYFPLKTAKRSSRK